MRAAPREASTVVLTRPGPSGLEVLLTQRPATMKFAAGLHVFPGGAVDPQDRLPELAARSTLRPEQAAAALGGPHPPADSLAYYLAALREMYEEAGVLLAEEPGRGPLAVSREVLSRRADVARGELSFSELCRRYDLRLRADLLVYLSRWITPASMPLRFDTRFFAAPLPPGQQASPDAGEVTTLEWMTPRAALEALRAAKIRMWLPTSTTLHHLADARDFEEIRVALAGGAQEEPLRGRLSPRVRRVLAGNRSLLTGPGTNAYVVGGAEAVVIDPAIQDEPFLAALEEEAREREEGRAGARMGADGGRIAFILLTHVHPDHVGGAEELADRHRAPVLCGPGGAGLLPFPAREIRDGETIRVEGATLQALHTPGHAPEHLCFLLEEERALFSGDLIVGEGTVVISPPEGDMADYITSLRRLQTLELLRIYPGHYGPIERPDAALAQLIAHRQARTARVVAALASGARSIEDLLARVYDDVAPPLLPFARDSLEATLQMLERAGRARRAGGGWEGSD
jgi:glyoxylase-like metal-dependent hydrolase (beta-lactamase superfamily II)/8-oxo-dGTP pyrophosphatase MutT (NUDIX family)